MLFAPEAAIVGTVTVAAVVELAEHVAATPPTVAVVPPTMKLLPVTERLVPLTPEDGVTLLYVGAL